MLAAAPTGRGHLTARGAHGLQAIWLAPVAATRASSARRRAALAGASTCLTRLDTLL